VVARKSIAVVGSTGSIGVAALEVVAQHSELFHVDVLVAGSNFRTLAEQIKRFHPTVAGLVDETAFQKLVAELGQADSLVQAAGGASYNGTRLVCGECEVLESIKESGASLVLAAAVGMAGLPSVMCALESGKDVALANKEALVVAGSLVLEKARQHGVRIIPVDSEHSAIFQVLQNVVAADLSSVIITASGGPFRRTPLAELASITPVQALKHPQWSMGAKITIDSATMMNKALEVIEAHWLFDVPSEQIEVIVHPQSIIHSMIRLKDNSVIAQASLPDMKGPIAYALNYPSGRLASVMERLDFAKLGELTFEELDNEKFPSVERARACLQGARGAAAVFNAANEVAVQAFLKEHIPFLAIHAIIGDALDLFGSRGYSSLAEVQDLCASVAQWARHRVSSIRK
jgi:1-deoxy-D-xylulose-5-phosphate reductoisomerase